MGLYDRDYMRSGNGGRTFRTGRRQRPPWIVWAALIALIGFILYLVI